MGARIYDQIVARRAMTTATRNATTNGDTIDRASGSNTFQSVMFVIYSGTMTDGTHVFKVQDSDDGTTFADAAAADVTAATISWTGTNDDIVAELGYHGGKRYCRLVSTVTPGATGGVYGASCVLGAARKLPTH